MKSLNLKILSWSNHLRDNSEILIIHHWDTDGIASSVMIRKFLNKYLPESVITAVFAEIGTYRLLPLENSKKPAEHNLVIPVKKYDACFLLDYSVPYNDIVNLRNKIKCPVIVYDHHLRKPVKEKDIYYYNPVAEGEKGEFWPSCTWVIKEFFRLDVADLIILGVAADMEERFDPSISNLDEIVEYLSDTKKKYKDYIAAKDLIDIHYKENDINGVYEAADFLFKTDGAPDQICNRSDWVKKNCDQMEQINEFIKKTPEFMNNSLEIHRITSKKNIISTLSRKFAAITNSKYVVIINDEFINDDVQIYARRANSRKDLDTSIFKDYAAELGGQVGGKEEVAGIILKKDLMNKYIKLIKERFSV